MEGMVPIKYTVSIDSRIGHPGKVKSQKLFRY